ncbi:MAG: diguanylate cyclase [Paucibacter sp.]|nr:diguanylate cyclase [Roseateles sp.]
MTTEANSSPAAGSLRRRFRPKDLYWILSALLAWAGASWWLADAVMRSQQGAMVAEASAEVERSADNLASIVSSSLAQLHGIPVLASGSQAVLHAVSSHTGDGGALTPAQRRTRWTSDPALLALDRRLQDMEHAMNVGRFWVLNDAGDCIASSNFDQPDSTIGTNYADRDYFAQAMSGRPGFQYAVGRTTNVQGLFFSAPVVVDGQLRGVTAINFELSRLGAFVRQLDSFLTDAYGVVILSTDPAREFQALPGSAVGRLTPAQREARYKRGDFAAVPIAAAAEPGFPALVRLGRNPDPALLAHRELDGGAIGLHVVHHLPGYSALKGQRTALFLLLCGAGVVVVALVVTIVGVRRYRQAAVHDMAHSLSLLRATLDATEDGILVVDMLGATTISNQRFVDIWQIPPHLLQSRDDAAMLDYVRGQLVEPQRFLQQVMDLYGHPDKTSHDVLHFRDGRVIDRFSFPQRLGTEVCGRVWAFRDVTQRERTERQIRELAFYDPLTELPNRRLFHDRLMQVMSASEREQSCAAVLFLDLDRFKWLNDRFGHDAGDRLLREVADRLRARVRESDTVARFGGDEFVVLLAQLSGNSAEALLQAQGVAAKIRMALRQPVAPQADLGEAADDYTPSASIGVCVFKGKEMSIDELLRRADLAMYEAKSASRGQSDDEKTGLTA